VPTGINFGVGSIFAGGNPLVGCGGAGAQTQNPGGYGNNLDIMEGPWCLPLGNSYDLIFIDDWGDGGIGFDVFVNGYQIESFDGMALGGTFTFTVEEPPAYDLSVFGSNIYSYVSTGAFDIEARVFNNGLTTITSYDLNYSVDGGAAVTHNVAATNLINYADEATLHSVPLNIPTNGVYTIRIWADNLNGGNADMENFNDTLTVQVEAGPGTPNYIDGYVGAVFTIDQVLGSADQVNDPTDLDFHPVLSNKELWVMNRGTEGSGSSTVTAYNTGEPGMTSLWKQDGNAWHFMSLTTGLAFSQNGNWGSSPGVYDANHDGGAPFTGPSLWSSNMGIYAEPSGGNGSHLDMLHLSPLAQGIAAEKDNVFWIVDGNTSDIVRYDFAEDHGPGNSFHGDAIIRRYSDDAVTKDPANTIVSHCVLDENSQWLYVVDHGNGRVIRIDINTGSDQGGAPNFPGNEAVVEYSEYTGYTQELMVSGLAKPAGIDVIEDRMIVSEYTTGEVIIYDISQVPAVELERLNTGMSSVQGIKIGPDGRIWFVDGVTDGVYKVETADLGLAEHSLEFKVYPNPTSGEINIYVGNTIEGTIEIRDIQGKLIASQLISGQTASLDVSVSAGLYFVNIISDDIKSETKRLIVK
ncbi:MAG: T9SS type A sorting domain-containing protein, partial [Crocinitomicaceae bacterium]|nr:T9SS type A sorting domain-containing protein [Crocinitomicaceae bacterium]